MRIFRNWHVERVNYPHKGEAAFLGGIALLAETEAVAAVAEGHVIEGLVLAFGGATALYKSYDEAGLGITRQPEEA